ncbi:leucine-rich repeat protein [Collinsella tanakaei]|uniref:leucine-rich repeat protein n=1 Tax=Collinsella tanakaei TaxID=626935 RepID=UPI0025A41A16|nr:leucine-rich repeat protein [Collinsella tanakaei]MDM8246591.1 leucine-rich repeat protein [Collinsella tanakaei]
MKLNGLSAHSAAIAALGLALALGAYPPPVIYAAPADYQAEQQNGTAATNAGDPLTWNNLKYRIDDDGDVMILGLVDQSATKVTIPETIDGATVTSIAQSAFFDNESIIELSLPNTLLTIGDRAFSGCSNISSVDLPNSLELIGGFAFSYCDSIKSATIPGGITYINAFSYCAGLESIYFEDGTTSLGYGALAGCPNLKKVRFPSTLESLTTRTFEGDSSLTHLEFPEGFRSLGTEPFTGCTALESVVFPMTANVSSGDIAALPSTCTVYVKTRPVYESLLDDKWQYGSYPQIAYVEGYPIEVESISMDRSSALINLEKNRWTERPSASATLSLSVFPSEAVYNVDDVVWTSSDAEIAYVDGDNLTCEVYGGQTPGIATITATIGDLTAICKVQVADLDRRSIKLHDNPIVCSTQLDVGAGERWVVDDPSVMQITATSSVDHETYRNASVTVKPLKAGETTVCCYVGDTLMYRCDVIVTEDGTYYLDDATISGIAQSYPLTSGGVTPKPTVAIGTFTLQEGTDYTLSYKNNNAIGTATVTITGIGRCVGTYTLTFQIVEGSAGDSSPEGGETNPDGPSNPNDPAGPDYPALDKPFPDVATDSWYYDAVCKASDLGLMNGYTGTGLFGPNNKLTREQAAAVLYNYLGDKNDSAPAAPQTDVKQDEWYSVAVNWAVETGIMNGYEGGSFGIGDALTREQFAIIIANAAKADTSTANLKVLNRYPDGDRISSWAKTAMAWAIENGIVNGVELRDGTRELRATETMTRAQMAAMMVSAIESGILE